MAKNVAGFADGGYRYIEGVSQYSGGVAADPGNEIVRVRLAKPLPLAAGFKAAAAHLESAGCLPTALCACELRSPAPFSEDGFVAFNQQYIEILGRWGIIREGVNPVARTNVCPQLQGPSEPALYAFSYVVRTGSARPSFVISGSGEAREGGAAYRDSIVRYGDLSPAAMAEKVAFVCEEMSSRLAALGFGWADVESTQVYTVHDTGSLVWDELAKQPGATGPIEWHLSRPPVEAIEYEMDLRSPARSEVLA
jgi:hypothetical protein